MGEETAAIELRGVRKRFGEIVAVDGLDLVLAPGICLGLLGPNGAGKSTTMRMLTAQTLADEGLIRVLGYILPAESKQAVRRPDRRGDRMSTIRSRRWIRRPWPE